LGPLFFASVGLEVNGRQVIVRIGFFILILMVLVIGKVLGCSAGAWLKSLKQRTRSWLVLEYGPTGEDELITVCIGWSAGLISPPAFSLVVVLVLVTTLIAPVLLLYVAVSKPEFLLEPCSSQKVAKGGLYIERERPETKPDSKRLKKKLTFHHRYRILRRQELMCSPGLGGDRA